MAIDVDEFRTRLNDTRVGCEICNAREFSLVAHLLAEHKMSPGQYKKKYPEAGLVSPVVSEIIRRMGRAEVSTSATAETVIKPLELKQTASELLGQFKPLPATVVHADLIPERDKGFKLTPSMTAALAYAMQTGKPAYVAGPTGCGKTAGIIQMHAAYKMPVRRVNMNGDVTVANFIGNREVDPVKGTYFKEGILIEAMRAGHTLLIDEIDYTPPTIAAVLNSILERGKSYTIPETGVTITAEPGFKIFATANTAGKGDENGMYTGTEIMNSALLDRFPIKLTVDYMEKGDELAMLLTRYTNVDPALVENMVKFANEIRRSFKDGLMQLTMSTRKLMDFCEMYPIFGTSEAIRLTLLNWMDPATTKVAVEMLNRIGVDTKDFK